MKKIILLMLPAFMLSCAQQTEQNAEAKEASVTEKQAQATETESEEKINYYGAKITESDAVTPKVFRELMEGKDSLRVKLEAPIIETCQKKGCWMDIDLGDEETMTVKFKDYDFFVPKEGVAGKTAIFEGVAFMDTVSVEMLQHLAEDRGAPQEEIEAIDKPKVSLAFEATGVIIKG